MRHSDLEASTSLYGIGFAVAGVAGREYCTCGNNLDNEAKIPDDECHIYQCPGNSSQNCGGDFKAAVWTVAMPGKCDDFIKHWKTKPPNCLVSLFLWDKVSIASFP